MMRQMNNCGTESELRNKLGVIHNGRMALKPAPVAERVGFEPTLRQNRKPDFESGAFDHSATFPRVVLYNANA